MFLKTQKFMILGASKSGYAVAKYLLAKKADCSIYEEFSSEKTDKAKEELSTLGCKIVDKEERLKEVEKSDVIIISPGIPINHELAVYAKKLNKRIVGELEFGFSEFLPITIGVTGTNGKTTTVSLIDSILTTADISHKTVGNIGVPVSEKIEESDKNSVMLAEVSSFQLESISSFCPTIACILNVAPDHLERHYTMENYIFLKKRIMKNQRESDYAVLNYDDEIVKSFAGETKAKVIWVSLKSKTDGAYVLDGAIYYKEEFITSLEDFALIGEHNVYNALFSVVVSKLLGIDNEYIKKALKEFKGVKHRLELISKRNGIKIYNDSKSTNTSATITALDFVKRPTVLILGGSEKGESYDLLFKKVKESPVKHIVITGASRFNMLESAGNNGVFDITVTENFELAIKVAMMMAESEDCILFSPACASFDKFSGYEERGDCFVKTVEDFFEKSFNS